MDQVRLKFVALNKETTTAEETFTVRQLKEKYPKLWLKSNQDYQIFINFCLERWGNETETPWSVVTYSLDQYFI